jgi:integrase
LPAQSLPSLPREGRHVKITDASARALTLPPGVKDRTTFDEDLPRFGVRLRAGGSARYVVHYAVGRKERRVVLGAIKAMAASKARTTAKDILAKVRLGQDPLAEKLDAAARATETLGSLLPRYLEHKRATLRPRSYIEIARHLEAHAKPLHGRPLASFPNDRRLIAPFLDDVAATSGPTCANMVRSSLSAYCRWLMKRGVLDANPMLATNLAAAAPSRDHLITDAELRCIWQAADGRYGAIVKLLAVLGLRREEIGGLLWEEIDLEEGVIHLPADRCKNKKPHDVPLTDLAIDILSAQPRPEGARHVFGGVGRGGFGGWSVAKRELDAKLGDVVRPWVVHDLRRVISTAMHERLKVAPHIVEAVLGHHGGGVAAVYNRSQYADEKRIALGKWAALLEQIVTGMPAGKVLAYPRR